MKDISTIKAEVSEMAAAAFRMLEITHSAFMEHDTDLVAKALEEESKLNDLEKTITTELVDLGRSCAKRSEREKAVLLAEIVGDLELIGDYCKDILERVEIKIGEKLLFSDDAVAEYNNLYAQTRDALSSVCDLLEKWDPASGKSVIKKGIEVDTLVNQYRASHNQRLLNGVCVPIACNMYLNMLDFTAAIFSRSRRIAENLIKFEK